MLMELMLDDMDILDSKEGESLMPDDRHMGKLRENTNNHPYEKGERTYEKNE